MEPYQYIPIILIICLLLYILKKFTNTFCFMNIGSDCGYFKPNLDNIGLHGDSDAQYIVSPECMEILESKSDDKNATYSELRICSRDIECGQNFVGAANIGHENDTLKITGCEGKPCECIHGDAEGSGNDCINGYKCKEGSCDENYHFNPLTKDCETSQCHPLDQSYIDNNHAQYIIDVNTCDTTNLFYNSESPPTISDCGLTCKNPEIQSSTPLATCKIDGTWEFTGCGETGCLCDNGTPSGTVQTGECSEEDLNNCSSCYAGYN